MMWNRIKKILRQFLGKDLPKTAEEEPHIVRAAAVQRVRENIEKERVRHYYPIRVPRPGSQIRDYGNHFKGKGKHQSPSYRKTVLEKIQPEED